MPLPTLSRRKLGLATGATALLAMTALAACDPAPNKKVEQLTIAGSDTTQNVMEALAGELTLDGTRNTDPDVLQNILAQQFTPKTVPADEFCGARTYATPAGAGQTLAPNGSSAGRDALKASVNAGDGCIDVARSSSPPRASGGGAGQDLDTFQYFAYALDAVSPASASTLAPADLSLAEVRGIYNCTFTNWNQVGGGSGPIERYWPQANSGTKSFFQADVLGFDPLTVASCAGQPAPTIVQENSGSQIASNGDQQRAIVPFSAGSWVAQERGTVTPDDRAGQEILSLNGQSTITGSGATAALNTAGPVRESNVALIDSTPAYPGIRYVWNVLDSTSKSYSQAAYFLGFGTREGSSFKSPLCNGSKASTLTANGFAPLPATVDAEHNPAGSTCRLWKPV